MNRLFLTPLLIFLLVSTICAQNDGKNLFDNTFLHQIKFESSTISNNDLWDSLSDEYSMVNMIVDGERVDSVGIRHKGFTSKASEQKPLKIDINEYVKGKKYDGLKKFNLHNNFKDDYLQRERLAYELYRRAGLPSPRTSYAEVFVGDNFVGVYSIVEQIDKTFLKHNFPSDEGSLIKAEPPGIVPGLMLEVKQGTMDEFNFFRNNANASNFDDFVHLRSFLKQMAVDIIIEDWDSYSYNRHNFYVYYEEKSELLNFINYDHNYAFAVNDPNKFLYPLGTYPLSNSLLEDPVMKQMYEQTLCELLQYLLDADYIVNETTNNYNIISSNNNGVKASDPASLIQYITDRKTWLQDTLVNLNVVCNDLDYPYELNDLVINEFVAWSDSAGGIQEPNGGTPDWIELYNNSSSDIILNKNFYLSDDENFPKKWYFPEEIVIPSKDYLIIWADKDVHQQGIHAGFKIEKSGGDLLMTYENMSEIQQVSYEQQSLNMANARVPNGTGNFMIQELTFNSNNGNLVGIEDAKDWEVRLYPNPADEYIWLSSNQTVNRLIIINLAGQVMRQINDPLFPVTIHDLEPGVYFFKINANTQEYIQKIFVK